VLAAWSLWLRNAAAICRQRCLVYHSLRRVVVAQAAAAFSSWLDQTAIFKRKMSALSKMLKGHTVFASFDRWLNHTRVRMQARAFSHALESQFVMRWKSKKVFVAFVAWHYRNTQGSNVRGMRQQCVQSVLTASYSTWGALTSYQRYLRRRQAYVENRSTTCALSRIWRAWCFVGQQAEDAVKTELHRLLADQQDRAQQVLEESEASRRMVMCHRLAQFTQRLLLQQLSNAWSVFMEGFEIVRHERAYSAQEGAQEQMRDAVLIAVTKREKLTANFVVHMRSRTRKVHMTAVFRIWGLQAQAAARGRRAAANLLSKRTLFMTAAAMRQQF
jgi:hypothetical protein